VIHANSAGAGVPSAWRIAANDSVPRASLAYLEYEKVVIWRKIAVVELPEFARRGAMFDELAADPL
jgi:hypothetical protein